MEVGLPYKALNPFIDTTSISHLNGAGIIGNDRVEGLVNLTSEVVSIYVDRKVLSWITHKSNKTMTIANSIKKDILNDWSKGFQGLSPYTQNKLYKVIGPFVTGVEIFKLPRADDYRPYFVCYPLWKSNEKECLDEPIILQEIKNKRGLQFNIPYIKHDIFHQEAVECTRKQIPISFDRGVSLENMFEAIDSQFSYILVKSSPVQQAKLFAAKLFAALYVNDTASIKKTLEEVHKSSKNWIPSLFEWKFRKLDDWLQAIQEKISNRERFLKQIEINKQEKKISELKSSELTV
jgi:hypothetical protein